MIFRACLLCPALRLLTPASPADAEKKEITTPASSCALAKIVTVLHAPMPPFEGKIEGRAKDSRTDFSKHLTVSKNATNVLLMLFDDVAFITFSGVIQATTFEALAKRGLRYDQFHTIAMCSTSQAALLTGRNHHSAHTGQIMEMATRYQGYASLLERDTATISEILQQNGRGTALFGKDHNVPDFETSADAPFSRWSTGMGFEKFYGVTGSTQPIGTYVWNLTFLLYVCEKMQAHTYVSDQTFGLVPPDMLLDGWKVSAACFS